MSVMKSFTIGIGTVALVLCLTTCGIQRARTKPEPPYVPKADEQFYGIWLNENLIRHQKFINHHWGLVEVYGRVDDKFPEDRGTYSIFRKWKDGKGNVWYASVDRYERNSPGVVRYTLTRISEEGRYEQVSDVFATPNESDLKPSNPTYEEWRRKP
jgi:hypothetical protein